MANFALMETTAPTLTDVKKYADTRRYDLLTEIGETEVTGWFRPFGVPEAVPEPGVSTVWTPGADILTEVEKAVYDNPVLLEDYHLKLVVNTPRVLYFPTDIPPQLIEESMAAVYNASPDEYFTERQGEHTAAFHLCDGMKAFLGRTFAGVTPRHHLSALKEAFGSQNRGTGVRVYADLRSPWMNLLAFRDNNFLHASVHQCLETADAAYFIFALWQSLGLAADEGELNVSGPRQQRSELMTMLREHLNYVMLTLLPRLEGAETIPASVLLESLRND